MAKVDVATVHGRFQGLHWGHMEYLTEAKKRCNHLFVGITHYLINTFSPADKAYPTRYLSTSNPFSYFDRYIMLKNSLIEYGLKQSEFDIIPFPIENTDLLLQFIPPKAKHYMTIYDQWGCHKYKLLTELGLDVEVMWIRDNSERFSSGTEVRRRIRENEEWESLVPPAVYKYIRDNDIRI